jgi:hypothetical protein
VNSDGRKEAAAKIQALADSVLAEETAAGYQCILVKPPAALRAMPGCRSCHEPQPARLGISFLSRRREPEKVLLYTFLALCEACIGDEGARGRVMDAVFGQGILEPLQ